MVMYRKRIIQNDIQAIGEEAFPEDDVRWQVKNIRLVEENYALVHAMPLPSTVGYDSLVFVIRFETDGSYMMASCFCREGGGWELLFTDPGEKTDWNEMLDSITHA